MKFSVVLTGCLAAAAVANPLIVKPLPFFSLNLVQLEQGSYEATSDAEIISYLGIPYGVNTGGRFSPSDLLSKSTNFNYAQDLAPICPQDPGHASSTECLYANIWLPADVQPDENLPVVVYVHGGYLPNERASAIVRADLSDLVRKSVLGDRVIAVSIHYRSNVFGLFTPEAFVKKGLNNLGLQDVRCAFNWVKKNIANFGGNPKAVTAFGYGTGASIVGILMRCKKTHSVPFQKAILLAGGERTIQRATPAQHTAILNDLVAQFKCGSTDPIECLSGVFTSDLIQAAFTSSIKLKVKFGPVIDNDIVLESFATPLADSVNFEAIPLLVGAPTAVGDGTSGVLSKDDLDLFLALFVKQDAYISLAKKQFENSTPTVAADTISGLVSFTCPQTRIADTLFNTGAPVFKYIFNYSPQATFTSPVLFSDFAFVSHKRNALIGADENALADNMSRAILSFIVRSDPATKSLGVWPKYTPETKAAFVFSIPPTGPSDVSKGVDSYGKPCTGFYADVQ
ncbi:hypothetical protein HDU97_009832 [Phlyctochytrium planicorne]|nr:hypothetical protein HDU97_009832 [Phlyctochytrium planicorne]